MNKFTITVSILLIATMASYAQADSIIDLSSWDTFESSNPYFPNWEIKFPQNYKCPEEQWAACLEKSRNAQQENAYQGDRIVFNNTTLTLCTEDFKNDYEPRATFCVYVESPQRRISSEDFFSFMTSKIMNPDDIEKRQNQGVTLLKVNAPVVINGQTVVQAETQRKEIKVDLYFIEKTPPNFIRISVVKHKLADAQKRSEEIRAIISSFKFIE